MGISEEIDEAIRRAMDMRKEGAYTVIPSESIRLTDTTYPIGLKEAYLAERDIELEERTGGPSRVRKSLEKMGYEVYPILGGREKEVL